jgi:hypothetical protein
LLLLCSTCVIAQSPRDSLYSVWNDISQADTVRLNALNEMLYVFRPRPDTMLMLADEMHTLATRIQSKRYQVDATIQQGSAYIYY